MRRLQAAFTCGLVLGPWAVSALAGQSLASVARKEEERRKTVSSSGKVYTNKDLDALPRLVAPPPVPAGGALVTAATASRDAGASASAAGGSQAKPEGNPEEKSAARDQAYWAGRMKELRTQLSRNQTYAAALQMRVNALTTDFINRDDPVQRAALEKDRQTASAEVELLNKAIAADKKSIADLEEESRRANVPPGWLR